MGEVERVPKNGRNDHHGYSYAMEADITAAVRKGLSARHLVWIPEVKTTEWTQKQNARGVTERICTLVVAFHVHDGDSGESMTLGPFLGEGQDPGDKATYKAMTGATKYAIMKTFLIPTGDDPENEPRHEPPPVPPPPARGTKALNAKLDAQNGPPEPPPPSDADAPQAAPKSAPRNTARTSAAAPGDFIVRWGGWKGKKASAASDEDVLFYLNGAREAIADPGKQRFVEQNKKELAFLEAEAERRGLDW